MWEVFFDLNKKERLLDDVAKKTNVNKDDILHLASRLENQDLKNEANLRALIKEVAKLAGKSVSRDKEDRIIALVKNNQVPKDIEKMMR